MLPWIKYPNMNDQNEETSNIIGWCNKPRRAIWAIFKLLLAPKPLVHFLQSQRALRHLGFTPNRYRISSATLDSECNLPTKSHFTHKTESPWPLHFKHSHWWKRRSWSKFASHYAWETHGVCECKMDVKSTWIPQWHRMDHLSWSLGLFSKTTFWK